MPPVKRKRKTQLQRKKDKKLKEEANESPSNESISEQPSSESQEPSEEQMEEEEATAVADESMNGEEPKPEEEEEEEADIKEENEEPKNEEEADIKKEDLKDGEEEEHKDGKEEEEETKKQEESENEGAESMEPANKKAGSGNEEEEEEEQQENGKESMSQNKEESNGGEEEGGSTKAAAKGDPEEESEEEDLDLLDQDLEAVEEYYAPDEETEAATQQQEAKEITFEVPPDIKTLVNKDTSPDSVLSKARVDSEIVKIRNLPPNMTKESLEKDLLKPFHPESNILSISVIHKEGSSQALLEFRRLGDAYKVRNKLNYLRHHDRVLEATFSLPQFSRMIPSDNQIDPLHPKATNVVFIANLCRAKALNAALKSYFGRFGKVKSVLTMAKYARPFAFIHMDSVEAAVTAIRTIITECEGMPVRLGYGKAPTQKALLVSNISPSLDRRRLRDMFSKYGSVGHLILDRLTSQAVIFYHSTKPASQTMVMLRGREFEGQRLMVELAPSLVQKKFINLLAKLNIPTDNINVFQKETFEIKDKSQKVVSDKPAKKEEPSEEADKSNNCEEKVEQLIEIAGLGTFHLKSSYP